MFETTSEGRPVGLRTSFPHLSYWIGAICGGAGAGVGVGVVHPTSTIGTNAAKRLIISLSSYGASLLEQSAEFKVETIQLFLNPDAARLGAQCSNVRSSVL